MKKTAVLLFVFFFAALSAASNDDVTGAARPSSDSLFVKLKSAGVKTDGKDHYLRKEAALKLKAMSDEFRKYRDAFNNERKKKNAKPFMVEITVISSTRTFDQQRIIWTAKWTGQRKSDQLDYSKESDPVKRGVMILKYSSMPGTSRHHWGTDVDLNSLSNSYYESGEGAFLYGWLVKNASRFGFCQPYTFGRVGGYEEEKWHWSYAPIANIMQKKWNDEYARNHNFFIVKDFPGASELAPLAPKYVNTINQICGTIK